MVSRPEESDCVFKLKFLEYVGFAPHLNACTICARPWDRETECGLKPELGGLVCRSCGPGGFTVSPGTLKIMLLIQSLPLAKLDRVRLGDRMIREMKPFLMACIHHVLGRELKSARFMEGLEKQPAG